MMAAILVRRGAATAAPAPAARNVRRSITVDTIPAFEHLLDHQPPAGHVVYDLKSHSGFLLLLGALFAGPGETSCQKPRAGENFLQHRRQLQQLPHSER